MHVRVHYIGEKLPMRAKERQNRKSIKVLEQFSGSQAAFGTTFKVTGGYRKGGKSFLKTVIRRIFTIRE
jgi:hypothetical protein